MPSTPPARPSVRIVKQSLWRGQDREFSNRYFFNGGVPADSGEWTTLCDNVVAAERLATENNVTFVEAIGYDAGSDVPVFSKAYSGTGSYAPGSGAILAPLEVCSLVRFTTDARSSKNHPIYLMKYMHKPAIDGTVAGHDTVLGTNVTLLNTYFAAWIAGFSDGAHTLTLCGPRGAGALTRHVEQYTHHRDFPNL